MSSICYVRIFNNYDKAQQFIQQLGQKKIPIYFKYVESFTNTGKLIQKKQIDNDGNAYNLSLQKTDQNDQKEYWIGTINQLPYQQIQTQNKKYWLEKQTTIQTSTKTIQVILSCLYEIVGNDFQRTLNSLRQNSYPSVISLYLISKKETIIKNFIQQFNGNQQNFIQQNFLQEVGNQILHLNKQVKNFNSLTSQVNGLTKEIFLKTVLPNMSNFKYTIKIDGMRTLLIIEEQTKNIFVLQASKQNVFTIKNVPYTVLDCEEYEGKYYVFDILVVSGNDITQNSYDKRLQALDNYKLPANCIKKKFYDINVPSDLKIAFQDDYEGIQIDGVIINEMSRSYYKTEAYKLKDKKHLTNDFLVKLINPTNLSKEEKKLINYQKDDMVYKLYCGGNPQDFAFINNENYISNKFQAMLFAVPYFKVQPTEYMIINKSFIQLAEKMYVGEKREEIIDTIQKALQGKFDDMIVECAYNDDLQPFPYKLRQDKTDIYKANKSIFGNYFETVLSNFNNIMDPITEEYLLKPVLNYFNVDNPDQKYNFFRNFGQDVRSNSFNASLSILKKMMGQGRQSQYLNVLDYGAGRNADYYLFLRNGFNTVIAYEPDRKSNIIYYDRIRNQINTQQKKKMPLTYIVLDGVAENPVKQQLSVNKINFFQSNYVIHYICESELKMKTLKEMILDYSCNNAIFYFTDNDYFPLLQKNNGLYDNGKYHVKIIEDNSNDKDDTKEITEQKSFGQRPFGQKIEVMMPWISEQMTYEYLVNIKAIQELFLPQIKLIQTIHHVDGNDHIPEDDREYLNCMNTYIFQIQK